MRPDRVARTATARLGGRRGARGEARDDVHAAGAGAVREGTAERRGLHLLRGPLAVVARRRAVDDATAGELRRTGRALAGAAGALLLVRLPATTAHLATVLRVVGALARRGELRDDDLVDQRDVRLDVEDLGGQVGGAGLLALRVEDVDGQGECGVGHVAQAPFTGATHEDDAALGAGDGALDEQQAPLGVDRVDGQVLGGLAVEAHATGHPHALEDARRGRGATDRARLAVVAVRTVGGADAVEAVTLHDTGGALALGGPR